jgi:hypothetical protein
VILLIAGLPGCDRCGDLDEQGFDQRCQSSFLCRLRRDVWLLLIEQNAPSKTEAAQLAAALLDQFGTTVKPGEREILDIDDTFCAAHGGQQLAFWNAHYDERGFASMHIYHVASGTPVG